MADFPLSLRVVTLHSDKFAADTSLNTTLPNTAIMLNNNKPFPTVGFQSLLKWDLEDGGLAEAVIETTKYLMNMAKRAREQGDGVLIREIGKVLEGARGLQAFDLD